MMVGHKREKKMIPVEFAQGENMVPREALSRWENAFRDLLSPKVLPGCQSFAALSKTETVSQLQSLELRHKVSGYL